MLCCFDFSELVEFVLPMMVVQVEGLVSVSLTDAALLIDLRLECAL